MLRMKMGTLKGPICCCVLFLICFIVSEVSSLSSCEPNPCKGRAKCLTAVNGSHYCECPANRIGDLCEYENPCTPNQCQNSGTCSYSIVDGRGPEFKCTCPIGYTASLCEISLPNACDSNPCKNRATCALVTINSFKCICPPGFRGDTCEQVDHCASAPCLNQGECTSTANGFKCRCQPGFTGPTCTMDVDECATEPCVRGKCLNLHGSYRCQCPEGYTGQKCESVYVPCEPSPCKNNARCIKYGEFKYHCECAPGYTGRHCEVNIDDCPEHQCKNGGQCVDGVLGYTCKCPKNYKGQFCQEDVDECMEASVCRNGGTCVNTIGGYHCICVNGWEGEHCQINHNDCVGTVCYNGGTCHDRVASFYCECPIGKTGLLCHLDDACMSNPCQSGAICTTNPVDGAYLCSCPKGYTGVDCSNDINECDINGNPCEHGGTCVNTPGSYACQCPKGWTGGWCEVNINECASNPCHNDATCLDDVGRFICVCMPGFTGLFCETDTRAPAVVGCSPNPCQHGGSCQRKENGFECFCTDGFEGSTCQTAVNACESDPCENGATCSKKGSSFSCKCAPSFTGDRCQVKLDPCRGNHCENGAVCTPTPDYTDFSCSCPVGFTGPFCSDELNECASNPCQHGGVCFDKKNGFECSCVTGYSGLLCEANVDDCADKPCLNGGTCIDGVNRYSCHCVAQFTGDRCQHTLDPCRGHHCDNGAVCTPSANYREYKCQCPAGFTGSFCVDDIDECADSPCLNGAKCINSHGSYRCKCADGFTGHNCEVNHDECASNPCLNQGRCVDTVNGFRCECQPGFSGRQCATNVDECSSSPCQNGATCVDGVDGYVCLCRHGFSGTHCHINDPDCQPGLCLNGGLCVDGVNTYRCECARGYAGKNCQTKVDLDAYNATDHYEGELCKRKDCMKKANNGICDAECNFFACNYDEKDCSAGLRPFENCTATPSYCAHVFRDGKCDDVCNNEACLFDGFDCQADAEPCNPLYVNYCVKHFANGKCDAGCNTAGCGFDGGDCEQKKEAERLDLTGDVVVILLVDSDTFVERANHFLMTVSKALRATVRIKTNADGRPLVYQWDSTNGLGPLAAVDADQLKGLTSAESRKKRSAAMERLTGVLVVLSVDVSKCKDHERDDCFSDVLSVAAYLGAANAKQDLQELGMPLYSAYGQKPLESAETAGNPLMVAVISLLCMLALVLLALMVLANRKRKITAPVWVPPIGGESSKVSSMATGVNMVGKGGDLCYHSAPGNTYDANEFVYKRARRVGPEGEELPAAALGHYLDFGQQPTEGNYDNDSVFYENGTLPIKLSAKDEPRKWTREHYEAAGAAAPVHAPAGDVNARGPLNQTPIMIAATHGRDIERDQARAVKQLIDRGAPLGEHTDGDGDTALMLAVRHSRDEAVRVMLQQGGDPTEYNTRGDTALHHAITINNANILRMLLETGRCDVDHANYDGQTPLILAAKISHASTECAQLLLKYKADCFGNGGKSAADNDGKTALHWAAVNNNVELIDLLITHGANKDAQDNKDQTPLFLAAREGHMEAVERLVQAGASKEISDQMERWPREIAEENGRHAVANYLDKVPSPHLPPHGVGVGGMNTGGTLPHSIRPQKPKVPRRTKSVRDGKDAKKPTPPKKPVMSPQDAMYAQQQHLVQHQRLIPGAVRSPPSVPNMESPYSNTPSPGNFMPRPGDCSSLQAAAASSCMLSPYSEAHSGSSTSGLSPPQATLATAKGYKSPPPYGTATSGGWQTSPESYMHHSPPEQQTYYPQQTDVYQPTVVDNAYGGYNAECYQQTQLPYCQQEQLQQHPINPGQTVDAYSANNGFYGYNVAHGMY